MPNTYDEIGKVLGKLIERITSDDTLDEEDKAQAVDLINDVVADPTPENLEALALVMEELGKSQEYLAAMDIVQKHQEDQENTAEEPVSPQEPAPAQE